MDFNMFNLTAGNYQILYRTNFEAHVEPLDDKKNVNDKFAVLSLWK